MVRCISIAVLVLAVFAPAADLLAGPPELPTIPTMGGKQFWADQLFFRQWRIQRHVLTGHCRLLDGRDHRHAWGTFEQCRNRLEQIKLERNLPPMRGKAVLVLHGLFRTRSSMDTLCRHLREKGGYEVFNVSYPSTRDGMGELADVVARVVDSLDGVEELHFVAHSMGNTVLRHYFADRRAARPQGPRTGPRFGRFVMLGPPNHGSQIAADFGGSEALEPITGSAARQLGVDWPKLEPRLATPRFPFGIVAGGMGDGEGFSSMLPGDDDGTITVATARLAGAHDYVLLPVRHTFMMDDPAVLECTLRFLAHGHFREDGRRQPIAVINQ